MSTNWIHKVTNAFFEKNVGVDLRSESEFEIVKANESYEHPRFHQTLRI